MMQKMMVASAVAALGLATKPVESVGPGMIYNPGPGSKPRNSDVWDFPGDWESLRDGDFVKVKSNTAKKFCPNSPMPIGLVTLKEEGVFGVSYQIECDGSVRCAGVCQKDVTKNVSKRYRAQWLLTREELRKHVNEKVVPGPEASVAWWWTHLKEWEKKLSGRVTLNLDRREQEIKEIQGSLLGPYLRLLKKELHKLKTTATLDAIRRGKEIEATEKELGSLLGPYLRLLKKQLKQLHKLKNTSTVDATRTDKEIEATEKELMRYLPEYLDQLEKAKIEKQEKLQKQTQLISQFEEEAQQEREALEEQLKQKKKELEKKQMNAKEALNNATEEWRYMQSWREVKQLLKKID